MAAMTGTRAVTLLVVTWNSRPHLADFFAHLPAAMEGVERWRLVVVDNASSDGTLEEVGRLWPTAETVQTGANLGYAGGINAGAATTPATDTLVVLNPDIRPQPGSVAVLARAAEEAGIAVPRLLEDDGSTAPSIRRDPTLARAWGEALLGGTRASRWGLSELVTDPEAYDREQDVDWATGAVVAVSPTCRAVTGAWDDSYFLYSEEVDYCRRAREAGFVVRYVPTAVVAHSKGEYATNPDLWRVLVRNRARDYARRHGPLRSAAFRLALATGEALRAPRSAAHRAGVPAAFDRDDPGPGPLAT